MTDRTRPAPARGERGFTLVEQVIAMGLIFGVLLVLLAAMGAGAAGVANGRQRTVATSLGKQAIEQLQSADYSTIAMNLASPGLASDSRVTGVAPTLTFEGEQLVGGGAANYRTTATVAATTYTVSTFITAVTPAAGLPYRRLTVFVDWSPSISATLHTARFSSLVYPVNYVSYPASDGTAEVSGARATVTGSWGAEQLTDSHFDAPGARATASAAILRTAQATSRGGIAGVNVGTGPLTGTGCSLSGTTNDTADCPVTTLDRMADNDASTSAPTFTGGNSTIYPSMWVGTPGGLTLTTPSGFSGADVLVDNCNGCGYGDGDALPYASSNSLTSTAAQMAFTNGPGGNSGNLWQIATGWRADTTVDQDATNGGIVTSSAKLSASAVKVFALAGAGAFDAAVRLPAFTAMASTTVNKSTPTTSATAAPFSVDLWDDTAGGYRTVSITPGTATDVSATGTVTVGGDQVTLVSRVQSQPLVTSSTSNTSGTMADGQQPSVLTVTVQATITGAHPGSLTITFDYGQVTAHGTWKVA